MVKMLKWPLRYHAYLVARATELGASRLYMRAYLGPWLLPLAFAFGVSWAFSLNYEANMMVVLPLGVVSLAGMVYTGGTLLYYGIKSDSRRRTASRASGG